MKDDIIQFQKQRIEALEKELQTAKDKLSKKHTFKNITHRVYDAVFDKPFSEIEKQYKN